MNIINSIQRFFMLRVSLIGVGDIDWHFFELLKMEKKQVENYTNEIAKVLVETNSEIVFLPDKGINFELAKKFKEFGGKKVIATVPLNDSDFGIKHLEEFRNFELNGKRLIDQTIDSSTWYKENLTHCIFGDVILMLGNSLGTMGELVFGYYLYKLFQGMKADVNVMKKKIHPEVRAGERIPFSVILFKPFLKEKLNFEIEEYIKKTNGRVYYVENALELKNILMQLNKEAK
ncbi:MAG: hypothetical protein Q7S21_04880 [archaeon]|nr:hypothetical protein [archaeon]